MNNFQKISLGLLVCGWLGGAAHAAPITVTASDSSGRSAKVVFDQSGDELHVNLFNMSSSAAANPTFILTAVMFNVSPPMTLTPGSAYLGVGSGVLNAPAFAQDGTTPLVGGTVGGSGDVGGEWGFVQDPLGLNSPYGAFQYGISSSGLSPSGVFGHPNFISNATTSIDLAGPPSHALGGLQFGIAGTAGLGSSPSLTDCVVTQNEVDFVLHGFTSPLTGISSVLFQYGTSSDDDNITTVYLPPPPTPQVDLAPEPASFALLGSAGFGGLLMYLRRRRLQAA
jgi:hypothetical protein